MRNRWLAVATVSVMFLAIFFISVLIMINMVGQTMLVNLKNKVDVSVYIKSDIEEQQIAQLRSDLLFLGEVKKVSYVSSGEAVEKFRERHKDNPVLMESLAELGNPLLPAINIEAQEASQYEAIIKYLQEGKYKDMIEKINYQESKPLIERLTNFSNKVTRAGIIISIILALVAGLVTFNTIRLAMYNFRDEVSVMRLVGASDWFIRGPFVVEAVLYGAIAALATLVLFFPFVYFLSPKISALVPGSNIYTWLTSNFFKILFFQLFIGIMLGGASSLVAIRKYLRV